MYKKVSYNNLIGKNIFDIKKNPISYDILTKISEGAFRTGRFYKDRRFEKSKADQVYSNWIFDHLNSENCRLFYYKNETGKICGFIAVSINIPFPSENFKVGFVQLVCTDYEERKKGLASKLLAFAENYLAENQIEHFYSNTTFDNFSSIMLFIKNGFIVYNSIYELHWWKK
ncbi:MAG TPA: GNAT family N-acetyltransferase [bacterium]|nr:GNAT family N-acetyltransferase [bacterium]